MDKDTKELILNLKREVAEKKLRRLEIEKMRKPFEKINLTNSATVEEHYDTSAVKRRLSAQKHRVLPPIVSQMKVTKREVIEKSDYFFSTPLWVVPAEIVKEIVVIAIPEAKEVSRESSVSEESIVEVVDEIVVKEKKIEAKKTKKEKIVPIVKPKEIDTFDTDLSVEIKEPLKVPAIPAKRARPTKKVHAVEVEAIVVADVVPIPKRKSSAKPVDLHQ